MVLLHTLYMQICYLITLTEMVVFSVYSINIPASILSFGMVYTVGMSRNAHDSTVHRTKGQRV